MNVLKVGVETDFLRGHMTGVGNYCLHIVHSLIDDELLQFMEFSRLGWKQFTWQSVRELQEMHGKLPDLDPAQAKAGIGRRAHLSLRSSLARIELARSMYTRLRAYRFSRGAEVNSLDLFHAFRFVPPSDIEVPTLPVVYDLSFVRFPEAHPRERLKELERLPAVISKSRVVQTISEFSRREINEVYGYPSHKIVVVPPAAAPIFRPLGNEVTRSDIGPMGLNIHGYLLAVGTLEPRKNLKTLITAYGRLPAKIRDRAPLVVAGYKGWGDLALPKEADQMVRDGTLRFLGSVPDFKLRSLYEGAIALLFPSVYEGFGMPVVEAFACGTQVVHSSNSSMDEITKGRSLRVPSADIDAWLAAINVTLDDVNRAAGGREQRMVRAQDYSWRESARMVKRIYDQFL